MSSGSKQIFLYYHLKKMHKWYYIPTIEIKDDNNKIDGKNFFDQTVKINSRPYDNIRKIATGRGDDYTTGCPSGYLRPKENYNMIAIDFSKQQELDGDLKTIEQINFTWNIDENGYTTIFFIFWKSEINHFRFFTRNCGSIVNFFYFNVISI